MLRCIEKFDIFFDDTIQYIDIENDISNIESSLVMARPLETGNAGEVANDLVNCYCGV